MTLRELMHLLIHGRAAAPRPSTILKERLSSRQNQVADRLAEMKGTTRDEVLAEAYRRADRILARKH